MVYTYGSAFSSAATVKITAFGNVMTRGFAAVALLSKIEKCLVSRTLHYVSINLLFTSHFNAYLSLFD